MSYSEWKVMGYSKGSLYYLKHNLDKASFKVYKRARQIQIKKMFPLLYGKEVGDTSWLSNLGAVSIFSGVWHIGQRLFHFHARYMRPGITKNKSSITRTTVFQLCSVSTFLLQLGQFFIAMKLLL